MSTSSSSINSLPSPSSSSSSNSNPRDITDALDRLDQLAPGKGKPPEEIKEGKEKVCRKALQILARVPDQANRCEVFAALKNSTEHIEIALDQKKRLYSALAKTPLSNALANKLDKGEIKYEELSDFYTLEFEEGEMKISKAELSTLGVYFTALFASAMRETLSKTIALKDLKIEQFEYLRTYVSDPEQYDLDDPDTQDTLKTLAARFNLLSVFPNSITPEQWANPAAFLATLPPMPQALVDFLAGPCPIYPGKTAGETHFVIPLIKNITTLENGVSVTTPRTLKTLNKLDKASRGVGCRYIWPEILKPEVDKPAEVEFQWAVMTKDVLPESGNKSYDVQKQIAEDNDYQVPGFLDAATCILWAHHHSGTRLYSDNPWTYTRCQEMVAGYHLVVGGFAPAACSSTSTWTTARSSGWRACGSSEVIGYWGLEVRTSRLRREGS